MAMSALEQVRSTLRATGDASFRARVAVAVAVRRSVRSLSPEAEADWAGAVAMTAGALRHLDAALDLLDGPELHNAPEALPMRAEVVAARERAFAAMRDLNPDQAWFWTRAWQIKEREADDDLAAGRFTRYSSDADFLAALDARMGEHADT